MKPGFRWKALIGWGAGLYAAMFLLWSFFIKYGFVEGVLPNSASILLLAVILAFAARSLHFSAWSDIFPYSLGWALVVLALDVLITVPFTGWAIFIHPRVLAGYALIILLPLLFRERPPAASPEMQKFQG